MYHSRASREQKNQTKPKKLTLSGVLLKAKHSSMLNNYCQNWIFKCSELGWASVFLPAISKSGKSTCCQLHAHRKPDAGCSHTWQLNPFTSSKSFTSRMHRTYSVYALCCHFSTQESIHKITCKVASSCYSYPNKEKGFSKNSLKYFPATKSGRGRKNVEVCFKGKINTSKYIVMINFRD